jgi:Domain of unknown function (DUF4124)
MGGIYRQTDANGQVTFSDQPSAGAGGVEALSQDGRRRIPSGKGDSRPTHEEVKQYIKDTQKYVPKVRDYFEYIEFLRSYWPSKHRLMLEALQREDKEAYNKLLRHPQFRPLRETALGWRAAERNVTAAVNVATGKFTGSLEKWLEGTVQDMMKQARWGGYADVLGSKTTTLPTKPVEYPTSRLGQYSKAEDARLAMAAKDSAKQVELAKSSLRSAKGAAVTRVFGPIVDVGIAALDIDNATAATDLLMRLRLENLARRNPAMDIDGPEYAHARDLLNQSRYNELDKLLSRFE